MIVTTVHIEVKPEFIQDFIAECEKNHKSAILEKGNLQFDILQETENSSKFLLYEAYETEVASAAHKQTSHYNTWRLAVEHMMAKPRYGIKHNILFPSEIEKW
jgi:autoinducer 2-degrading protein